MFAHALALLIEKSISCTTTTTATTTTSTRRQRDTAKCKKKKKLRRKYKAGEDMGKSLCDILRCAALYALMFRNWLRNFCKSKHIIRLYEFQGL